MDELPEGVIKTAAGIHVLATDSHLSRWVENHSRLDIADGQIAFFADRIKFGAVVIDAGACIGDHTATYAKLVGPTGRVIACEPNPLSYECLWRNFADATNVTCINAALGDIPGEAMLHVEPNVGASHLTKDGEVSVSVKTIDSLGLSWVDFIHLDCEGFELAALIGGMATLNRCRPVIVLEINHACLARLGIGEADVLALLHNLHYEWREIEPHLNSSYPQRDIIALPK